MLAISLGLPCSRFGFIGFFIGLAVGHFLLLRTNRGEALVASALSGLSRPHQLLGEEERRGEREEGRKAERLKG
jgi:hypothetical protein